MQEGQFLLLLPTLGFLVINSHVTLQACRLSYLSVGWSVCLVDELWKNGQLNLDAIWGGEWGRSRDGCIIDGVEIRRE